MGLAAHALLMHYSGSFLQWADKERDARLFICDAVSYCVKARAYAAHNPNTHNIHNTHAHAQIVVFVPEIMQSELFFLTCKYVMYLYNSCIITPKTIYFPPLLIYITWHSYDIFSQTFFITS